ncbi:hypothetical protein O1E19_002351 [Vibrio cholerae]
MSEFEQGEVSKPLVRTTLRISQEQNMFIEELVEQMNLSKQKVLSILLDKGMSAVKEEIQSGKSYSVNKDPFYLFQSNIAEELSDESWKELVDKIAIGSTIFFYSKEKGITAYGQKSDSISKKLSDFHELEHPISISDLEKFLGVRISPSKEKVMPFPQGGQVIKLPHVCPKCGMRANTYRDLEELFGLRNIHSGVRPQSWCRGCRSRT